MKRRTKDKVGAWPNMRDDTLRAVCDELIRARKKHPQPGAHLVYLSGYLCELQNTFDANDAGKASAVQIYALCATVAALAIRCLEEGTSGRRYVGNRADAPKFELEER